MVYIKSPRDLAGIKAAATIWNQVKQRLLPLITIGTTTLAISQAAEALLAEYGASATFKGYKDFPEALCISINEQLIHGVPSKQRRIKAGDLVKVDLGVTKDGYICDAAFIVALDPVSPAVSKIIMAAETALDQAIAMIKPGVTASAIGRTVHDIAKAGGYTVIKDFSGHGCGIKLHEDPLIPNYDNGSETVIKENMTICIEPMLMAGSDDYEIDRTDSWTVTSADKMLTCHVEAMIHVTATGSTVLAR